LLTKPSLVRAGPQSSSVPVDGQPPILAVNYPEPCQPGSTAQASAVRRWGALASMVTEQKVVRLGYHLKTGHTLSLQNRPTELTQDQMMLYRAGPHSGKCFRD